MDRLEAMSILLEAVEAGSLSAAGRARRMPLATVSRKISDLEAHLRTRLLIRSSRRLELTEAGRDYLAACKRILEDVGEAERAAAGEYSAPRGDLVVTTPIVFGRLHVLPVATEFLAAFTEINLRLAQTDRRVDIVQEHVDIALRIGELAESSQVGIRLGAIRRVVCGAPAYLARRGAPGRPEDLAGHDCVTFEGLDAADNWLFRTERGTTSAPVRSRLVVGTAEAAIDAAIAGAGLTRVLGYQAHAAVKTGALEIVLRAHEPSPWPVHLVHAGQGPMPRKTRAFLDFATPRLRRRLAEIDATDGNPETARARPG